MWICRETAGMHPMRDIAILLMSYRFSTTIVGSIVLSAPHSSSARKAFVNSWGLRYTCWYRASAASKLCRSMGTERGHYSSLSKKYSKHHHYSDLSTAKLGKSARFYTGSGVRRGSLILRSYFFFLTVRLAPIDPQRTSCDRIFGPP